MKTIKQKLAKLTTPDFIAACKATFRFSLPIVGQRLVVAVNGFIGMLMIARLGHKQLAAGALVTSTYLTLIVIATSLLYSVGVVSGQIYGAKKYKTVGKILRQGWLLSIFIAIPLIIVSFNIGPVLLFFRQQQDLVALTQHYFFVLAFGFLPMMIIVCCSQFFISVSKPFISLCFSIVSIFLTLTMAYILIFGKLGLPAFGMTGLAWAITIKNYFFMFVIFIFLYCKKDFRKYHIFDFFDGKGFYYLKRLFQIGYPISVQCAAELTALCVGTFMMGWIGQTALAARQVALQLNILVVMIPFGLSQASGILVGQAYGRDDYRATRLFGSAAILIGLICAFIVALIYWIFPKVLISLYINIHNPENAQIVNIAILLLAVSAFAQLFDAARNVATGALRGYHDTRVPMWVGIFVSWIISLPIGYLCAFKLHFGPVGLRLGFVIGFLIGAILIVKRFYKKAELVISSCE